jgi:hypothetical protein
MLDGVLIAIARYGVSSRPDLEGILLAQDLVYPVADGKLALSKAGRDRLREIEAR